MKFSDYLIFKRDKFLVDVYKEADGAVSLQDLADLFNSGLTKAAIHKIIKKGQK